MPRDREPGSRSRATISGRNTPAEIVDAVADFFAQWRFASLKLPAGWFGRPYDNCHELTSVTPTPEAVEISRWSSEAIRWVPHEAFTRPLDLIGIP